jgi:DNA repair protein RadA
MKDFKLTDLEKVGPTTETKLNKAGIFSPLDVVIRGAKEFSRISGLSTDMAAKHLTTMKKMLAEDGNDIEVKDVASLRALRARQIKVPLKVEELDMMTKKGFETQSLYEIYGDEGSGKTQMSMTIAAEALGNGHGVIFIDCEGAFDLDRFDQICQSRDITYDEEKLGYHMYSDESDLEKGIQNMIEELIERDVRYIIIDGLVGLMRLAFKGRGELADRQTELKDILKYLRNLSILLNIGVIITNQVTANPDPFGAKMKPIGGHVLGHYVKYIIAMSKGMKNNRNVRLIKSPNSPQGDYVCYLNEEGVSGYESLKARQKAVKMDSVGVENTQALIQKDLLLE